MVRFAFGAKWTDGLVSSWRRGLAAGCEPGTSVSDKVKGLPHALSEGLDLKAFAQSPVAPPAALRASGARLARPSRESPLERRGRTARSRDLSLPIFVPTVKVFRRGAWSCQGASAPPS